MGYRFRTMCVALLAIAAAARSGQLPAGTKAALYGDAPGHADVEVDLRPPAEGAKDIQRALEQLAKVEDSKSSDEDANMSNLKQKLAEAKAATHNLVHSAFAPLMHADAATHA